MSVKETFSAGQTREFFGGGDFFRLLETVAEITVEFFWQGREVAEAIGVQAGYAEYFKDRRFDRIRIYSATVQDVKWVVREGSDVRYDRGASQVSGVVGLDAATLAALNNPTPITGIFNSAAALVAGAAETVFTAAANVNGAIILTAEAQVYEPGATLHIAGFLAKATAPTTTGDAAAEVILFTNQLLVAGHYFSNGKLHQAQYIPAGKGLFYIDEVATPANAWTRRACRYKLL